MYNYYITNLIFKEINLKNINTIKILCYNINNELKYPFMQIMLEKNNEDMLILPFINIKNDISEYIIDKLIIDKVYSSLSKLLDINTIDNIKNDIIIDGYFLDKINNEYLVFINISFINIKYLIINKYSSVIFSLISEIVNTRTIYDTIKIHNNVYNFFIMYKELFLLYTDEKRLMYYNIPDSCYTIDEINISNFKLIFGQIPNNNKYHFYSSIKNFINSNSNSNTNGIIRYAVFYNENDCNNNNNNNNNLNYDIIITNYDHFYPLSNYILI